MGLSHCGGGGIPCDPGEGQTHCGGSGEVERSVNVLGGTRDGSKAGELAATAGSSEQAPSTAKSNSWQSLAVAEVAPSAPDTDPESGSTETSAPQNATPPGDASEDANTGVAQNEAAESIDSAGPIQDDSSDLEDPATTPESVSADPSSESESTSAPSEEVEVESLGADPADEVATTEEGSIDSQSLTDTTGGTDANLDSVEAPEVEPTPLEQTPEDVGPLWDLGPPAEDCDSSETPEVEPCTIHEQFGVFASPLGNDTHGKGTREAPYASLNRAISAARSKHKRVYACGDAGSYSDVLSSDNSWDDLQLFGGFRCVDFTYDPEVRSVVLSTSTTAWKLYLVNDLYAENFDLYAADATAAGASSLALMAMYSQDIHFKRVSVSAGRGADGSSGADGAQGLDGAHVTSSHEGRDGMCALFEDPTARQLGGGWSGTSVCGSRGGKGGGSTLSKNGDSGWSGTPTSPSVTLNNGGKLLPYPAAGADGPAGVDGSDALLPNAAGALGTFSMLAYLPINGAHGVDGGAGQGGGGGGGGLSATAGELACLGASGGSGGMGGCGGHAGKGGKGGGASVAVFSWLSTLNFDACDLHASSGGDGGDGGDGGSAGVGAPGAVGGAAATFSGKTLTATGAGNGGPGGDGGAASGGAGGPGGPSLTLVVRGNAVEEVNAGDRTFAAAGSGGEGGWSGATTPLRSPNGPSGVAQLVLTLE